MLGKEYRTNNFMLGKEYRTNNFMFGKKYGKTTCWGINIPFRPRKALQFMKHRYQALSSSEVPHQPEQVMGSNPANLPKYFQ